MHSHCGLHIPQGDQWSKCLTGSSSGSGTDGGGGGGSNSGGMSKASLVVFKAALPLVLEPEEAPLILGAVVLPWVGSAGGSTVGIGVWIVYIMIVYSYQARSQDFVKGGALQAC